MTDRYSDREIDLKLQSVVDASNNNRSSIITELKNVQNVLELKITDIQMQNASSLSRLEKTTEDIAAQAAYTNGKLKKTIMALIFLAGVMVGLGFLEAKTILPFLGL